MAGAAAATLSVDYRGRNVADGADLTLAFAVSEEGKAKLSLLGRDMEADVSFLRPVGDFLEETGGLINSRLPGTLRLMVDGVPRLYRAVAEALSTGETALAKRLSGENR